MLPEVINRKLLAMTKYLRDLLPYEHVSFEKFMEKHYEIERILELLIMTASDIVFHLLSRHGEAMPGSYKAAFLRAGELEIIPEKLSKSLSLSAGLRNILVHEYETIDYQIVHNSIALAIQDFSTFIRAISEKDKQ